MVSFIDAQRQQYGVDPICEVLPIAPSTYYERKAQEGDPERHSARAKQGEVLKGEIERAWAENDDAYGCGRCGRSSGAGSWLWLGAQWRS